MNTQKLQVLVIEDECLVADSLVQILNMFGYEAVRSMASQPILSSCSSIFALRTLTGFDVLAQLPSDSELRPYVIFVTAQDAVRALEGGAVDYLLKPFTRER